MARLTDKRRVRLGENITVTYDSEGRPTYGGIEVIVYLKPSERMPRNVQEFNRFLRDKLAGNESALRDFDRERDNEADLTKGIIRAITRLTTIPSGAEWRAGRTVITQQPGPDPDGEDAH
jgi:hypothetical protein